MADKKNKNNDAGKILFNNINDDFPNDEEDANRDISDPNMNRSNSPRFNPSFGKEVKLQNNNKDMYSIKKVSYVKNLNKDNSDNPITPLNVEEIKQSIIENEDNTKNKRRRKSGPLLVNLKARGDQKADNSSNYQKDKNINESTLGLVRQAAVELEDFGARGNKQANEEKLHLNNNEDYSNMPKKNFTLNIENEGGLQKSATSLNKKLTDKLNNAEAENIQPNKTNVSNTQKSEQVTHAVTNKLEDFPEYKAMKETNDRKLDIIRTLFYYSIEGKKEVANYIVKTGNYNSRNREVPFYIILPNGKGRRAWDLFVTIFLIYSIFIVPVDVGWCFECFTDDQGEFVHLTYLICTFLFVFDILVNFLTAYLNEKNQYIFDLGAIANNYLYTDFAFDALAALPFDKVEAFDLVNCFSPGVSDAKLYLSFSLIRLMKLDKYLAIIEDMLSKYIIIVRLIRILLMLMYLAHLFGNVFSGNSYYTTDLIFSVCNENETLESLALCKRNLLRDDFISIYFYSVFIGMYFLTGNELSISDHWERVYIVTVVIIALGINATVFGNVAVLISKMSIGLDPFVQEKIDIMKEYMNFMMFDDETIDTIGEYHKNIWMKQRNMMYPEDFFNNLSSALHKLILLDQWRHHFFTYSNFLPEVSERLFGDMLPMLQPKIFMKEEGIIFEGEITTGAVYFIPQNCSCSVKIGGEWVKNMIMGEYFGEIAIFLRSRRRTATITCLKNSDFLCVEGENFERLLQDYPDDYEALKIVAKDRLLSHIKLYPSKLFAKLVPKNDLKDYLLRKCIYLNDEEEDAIFEEKEAENTTVNLDKILPKIELFNNMLSVSKTRLTNINKRLKPDSEVEQEE